MSLQKNFTTAILFLAFSAKSFAQVTDYPHIPFLPWFGAGSLDVCEKDGFHHYILYYVWGGTVTQISDIGTPYLCDCKTKGVNIPESAAAPVELGANTCVTVGIGGEDLTIPSIFSPGQRNEPGGFPGGGLWYGPRPWAMPLTGVTEDRARFATSASASPPYAGTVPFRQFGLPPLYSGTDPKISLQCNSALNPTVFGVNHDDAVVHRDNMCTGERLAEIAVPTRPQQVRLTPDGLWAIVTSFDNGITFIDTSTNTAAKVIRTDSNINPGGLAISPDGSYALVTSLGQPLMLVLDIAKQEIAGQIPLGRNFPQSVRLSPDATLAWVTYPFDSVVEVIDILTGIPVRGIPVGTPSDIALNTTGTVAYIASGGAPGSVLVVDTKTYTVTKTIPAGAGATDLLLSSDDRILTVNNYFGDSITVIDTATLSGQTIPVSGAPRGAVLVPLQ